MKAVWRNATIAESDDTVVVEGNHYFPRSALREEHFSESTHTSVCGWKGLARYLNVVVDGETNPAAAWYYADPLPAAEPIRERIAFWKGVQVLP